MSISVIVNRYNKKTPHEVEKEKEKIFNTINVLKKRLNYLNSLYRVNDLNNEIFKSWYNVELVGVEFDTELLKSDDPNDYVGRGYDVSNGYKIPVYFTKNDIVKILKYNN